MNTKYNNVHVRKQDRVMDIEKAKQLLHNGEYGVLSLSEMRHGEAATYALPLSYVWDGGDFIYFHCAQVGYKLECIDTNPLCSFCVVGKTQVLAEKFSTKYESVVLRGSIERHLPDDEKAKALMALVRKYSPEFENEGAQYVARAQHKTEVLRFSIEQMTGKTRA